MKITINNSVVITNEDGKEFRGAFVGSVEYLVPAFDYFIGYDEEIDYGLAFKLLSGRIILVRRNHTNGKYITRSLKDMSFRILWDVYSDDDNIPMSARAHVEFEPVPCTEKFILIETDELPF